MNRILVIACCFALNSSALSQINIGLKAGIAISTLTQATGSEKPIFGIQASAVAKIQVADRIFLHPSLGYYPKGKKRLDETIEDELGRPVGSADVTYRIDYIELSTPFQYMVHDGNAQWLVGVGPFVSYAVGGRGVYKNISGVSTKPKDWIMVFGDNGANRADFGLTALFSTVLSGRWVLSLNFDQGLTNTDRWAKTKTISAGFTVGYFFR